MSQHARITSWKLTTQLCCVTNKIMFIMPEVTVIDLVSTVINESSTTVLELDCKQSLFSSKICVEECKSSECVNVTTSMTCFLTSALLAPSPLTTRLPRLQSCLHVYLIQVLLDGFSSKRETIYIVMCTALRI